MTFYQPFSTPSPLLVFPAASPSSKLRSTPTRKLPTPVDWTKEHNLIYSLETSYSPIVDDFPDISDDIEVDEKDFYEKRPGRNLSKYRRHSTPEFLNLYDLCIGDQEDEEVEEEDDALLSVHLASFKETYQRPTSTSLMNLHSYLQSNDQLDITSTPSSNLHPVSTRTTDTTLYENNNNNNNISKNLISSCYSSPNASLISLISSISSSYVSSYSNSEQSSSNNNTNSSNSEHLFDDNKEGSAIIPTILLEKRRGRKKRNEIPFPYQEKRKTNHQIMINHDTIKTLSSNSSSKPSVSTTIRERNYHAHFVKKKSKFSQLVSKMKRAAERPFKLIE